jgi:hypothetical protein
MIGSARSPTRTAPASPRGERRHLRFLPPCNEPGLPSRRTSCCGRLDRLAGHSAARDQPGGHRVGVPHLTGLESISRSACASPHLSDRQHTPLLSMHVGTVAVMPSTSGALLLSRCSEHLRAQAADARRGRHGAVRAWDQDAPASVGDCGSANLGLVGVLPVQEREHRHSASVVGQRAGDVELAQQAVDVLLDGVLGEDRGLGDATGWPIGARAPAGGDAFMTAMFCLRVPFCELGFARQSTAWGGWDERRRRL